ncbi:MAG: NAD(P)/FAD-dependent oxidoreductase [Vallitaleaceae bacterium]|nr:NAD(P)/FAD-dependent oxidoreductase [Vallitaleaceae bacterium]
MDAKCYDIIIIGAGVIGCAIARELSKYHGQVLLLEKENDVSCGASKANSGIVHGGYDDKHGSVKSRFCRKGNRMYQQLEEELHFGYLECGSMVLGYDEKDKEVLLQLKANGERNGIDDLQILEGDEIREKEPHLHPTVRYALYCPSAGVTSPYEMTIALCENAIHNGVELHLQEEVVAMEKLENGHFQVRVNKGEVQDVYVARFVINAAGLFSDKISAMLGLSDFSIHPRKGEYILLNKNQGHLAKGVLFQTPSPLGKGILVTRTYHGNLMLGPDAQEVESPWEVGTNFENLKYIVDTARKSVPDFDMKYTLNSFAGLRATSSKHDFIIEESTVKGFIQVAGIESPGLTSAPAIAEYVCHEILPKAGYELIEKKDFDPFRAPIIRKKAEDFDGSTEATDPNKRIVCRCEKVTEAEIVDALHRGIGIDHIDGIKRRTRCTMGPCQGQYCSPRVAEIIARERHIDIKEVTLRGKGSMPLPPRENRKFWSKIE